MKISEMVLPEIQKVRENANFTKDDEQVFNLLTKGYSIVQISVELNISPATTSRRIASIKAKMSRI